MTRIVFSFRMPLSGSDGDRSAPVLGRSNVRILTASYYSNICRTSWLAAPEDGRTPGEARECFKTLGTFILRLGICPATTARASQAIL